MATIILAIMVVLAVAGQGCSGDIPYSQTPAPSMVPYVDDPFAETGIRATPDAVYPDSTEVQGAGGIRVEWYAIDPAKVSGVRVGGYYVYRSVSRDETELVKQPKFSRYRQTEDTAFTDLDVEEGYIYSYYVTSYNRSDESQESLPSDTVHYMTSARPEGIEPIGKDYAPPAGGVRFFFGPRNTFGGRMAIEVNEVGLNSERDLIGKVWQSKDIYIFFDQDYIDYGGTVQLQPEHRYRWRVIKYYPLFLGGDRVIPTGNTSKWYTFTVR